MAIKSKDERKITEIRNYKVVKANELIQKSRYNLQVQEQKIILYLISKIKPENMDLKEHLFEIKDFCKICGLDDTSGANYKYIKQTLKDLRDKSIWLKLENGAETTLAWIDKVTIFENSGTVIVKIDDMMKPYLLQLKEHFTQYELLYTLGMKSQYSIRLYELLKSYEFQHEKLFEIEELKIRLSAETYNRFPDFKRRVLTPSTFSPRGAYPCVLSKSVFFPVSSIYTRLASDFVFFPCALYPCPTASKSNCSFLIEIIWVRFYVCT